MSNTHNTLSGLFTDVADAIREKTGESESIIADEFPDKIRSISSGGDYIGTLEGHGSTFESLMGLTVYKIKFS